jgi:hypothetical protein
MSDPRQRKSGELAYKNSFVFRDKNIPKREANELREYLYLFHNNLWDALEYLKILNDIVGLGDNIAKTELINRIYAMSLHSFMLSIRRIADGEGKRSARRLVNDYCIEPYRRQRLDVLDGILGHYRSFINSTLAHQGQESILWVYEHQFPDSDVVDEDMESLKDLYVALATELCSHAPGFREQYDYGEELKRLL